MSVPLSRRGAAVLTAALVSVTGIGLAASPAQAGTAPPAAVQAQVLVPAQYTAGGAIGAQWRRLGGSSGFLGDPTSAERRLRGGGASQSFQGGQIHWSPATGAHPTKGAIQRTWAAAGWERGRYGYPTGDEYPTPTGMAQQFQGGTITWTDPAKRPGAGGYVDKDCSDFTNRGDAQAYHDRWPGLSDLDGNDDGEACESLPW